MRHGLIRWDETELSAADIAARQDRLRVAMEEAGLDALILYTTHVRSAAVTWATGFTPYWSNAILLLPREGDPYFAVALSPRVGGWISATCPGTEVAHSPKPGALIGKRLAELGAGRAGMVELARLPSGHAADITQACEAELSDATALFAAVRAGADAPERALLERAGRMAEAAFTALPAHPAVAGDVTGAAEQSARLAGAEEVYMAAAPDLSNDVRFARVKGGTPLGPRFALRMTLARHGVWLRHVRTLSRDGGAEADLAAAGTWFEGLVRRLAAHPGVAAEIAAETLPEGLALDHWLIEAPAGTRPLQVVAETGAEPERAHAIATLTVRLSGHGGPILLAGPLTGDAAQ